jgi:hypothetical protein
MGGILPVIIAAKGAIDWFRNKNKESDARDRARKEYEDYYNSPYIAAVNAHLRQYFTEHGFDTNLLESLLKPRPFNESSKQFKNPGAGGAFAGALLDAFATKYKADQTRNENPDASAFAGPPLSSIVSGKSDEGTYGAPSTLSLARPALTRTPTGDVNAPRTGGAALQDPNAALYEQLFGQGANPLGVEEPPYAGPVKRFYQRPQGL